MHSKQQNVGRYLPVTQRNSSSNVSQFKSQRQISKNFVLMLPVPALVHMYTQQEKKLLITS